MNFSLESIIRCPATGTVLAKKGDEYISEGGLRYPIANGIPILLTPDSEETLWVVKASKQAATNSNANQFYEDTLGITPEGLAKLKKRLENHQREPEAVDPVISFLVGATSGYLYLNKIGKLKSVPIPHIRLPKGNGKILLDIGCNWGRWTIAAARLGYQVVGIDPSLGAVLAAKRLADSLGLKAHFVVGNALQLPFAVKSFDVIFSYSVFQHFSNSNALLAIEQAFMVSKSDAFLKIQMANQYGIRCIYHQMRRRFRKAVGFEVRYYSPKMLKQIFEESYGENYLTVDGFFGLGIQASDRKMMSLSKRIIISISEILRTTSNVFPVLTYCADSIYINAKPTNKASES